MGIAGGTLAAALRRASGIGTKAIGSACCGFGDATDAPGTLSWIALIVDADRRASLISEGFIAGWMSE
jgi:hypothetical protein